ncbi:HlyD family secretion protein [Terriglobus roseus]|uniref:Membrane fusion protein, multidrug efflux system n=1 Tax=Terriglobus roseus TaxID=392734 RepID=A0A1G7JT29_9BACT|nr:HlyD family secretion protein [Terriglobus roseus]SDF27944.1 membrane fusion protein, multidrug efflux system [Terriglobus roseus]
MADSDQQQQQQNTAAAPDPSETAPAKARRKFIIIVVVLLLVLVAGFFYWRSTLTEDTDDAQVDGDLYQVSARVSGQVIKVNVTDNQEIKQGDVIAEIDPRDYQVALEQAEAQLANAKASYLQANSNVPIVNVQTRTQVATSGSDVATAEASVAQAQKNVAAAQARVDQAKANALKAQLDVDRYKPLVEKDVISKQQFDQAVAQAAATSGALLEAQQNVTAQQAAVAQTVSKLNSARSDAAQARENGPKQVVVQKARAEAANADIMTAQAKVDQAKLNLSYCHIVAPIGGIINKKNVSVGQNISPGQNMLTIIPLDNLWITANFKETQLQHMKVGQEVTVKVDALGGRKYKGRVTQVGGATGSRLSLFPPENATGNYVKVVQRIPVRIDLEKGENDDHLLRPGYSVVPDVGIK